MSLSDVIQAVCKEKGHEAMEGDGGTIVRVMTGPNRYQNVTVKLVTIKGAEFVKLVTGIGPVSGMNAERLRSALSVNYHLPYGHIAIDENENMVLCEVIPSGSLNSGTLSSTLEYIAKNADTYEKMIFGTDVY